MQLTIAILMITSIFMFCFPIIDYRKIIIDFPEMANNFVKMHLSFVFELCEFNDHISFYV